MIRLGAYGNIHPSSFQKLASYTYESDVIVLVHGWNNTEHVARRAYATWFPSSPVSVVGIHWPATAVTIPEDQIEVRGTSVGRNLDPLANLSAYFQMRKRATQVGETGLATVIHALSSGGTRVHLVGHSFGALAVIAALHRVTETHNFRGSAILCLAACSHFVFARQYDGVHDGTYRELATRTTMQAPLLVMHSHNDTILKGPYAVASRLAGHEAMMVGSATDRFGALGVNGARSTPEARSLPFVHAARNARPGITNVPVHNVVFHHSGVAALNLPAFTKQLIHTIRHQE